MRCRMSERETHLRFIRIRLEVTLNDMSFDTSFAVDHWRTSRDAESTSQERDKGQ